MSEAPTPPDLELVAAEGPGGGPVFRYRGAEIRCLKGGHACVLFMEGHPFHGATFGAVGTVRLLVDPGATHEAFFMNRLVLEATYLKL